MNKQMKNNNGLNCPLFVLDVSFMKGVFENSNSDSKMLIEIYKRKQHGLPIKVVTTTAAFVRAVYSCNENANLQNIKFLLELLDLSPSTANFKDSDAIRNELLHYTKLVSNGEL